MKEQNAKQKLRSNIFQVPVFIILLVLLSIQGFGLAVGDFESRQSGVWGLKATWIKALTGSSVSFTNASTAVTGTGTLFSTELVVGDTIVLQSSTGIIRGKVASITNATNLILTAPATASASGRYGKLATPTSADGVITVLNGHTVTVSANVTTNQTVIDSGGQVIINAGRTLSVSRGTAPDFTVNGTVTISGTLFINTASVGVYAIVGSPGAINVASGGVLYVGNLATMTVNGIVTEVSGANIYAQGGNAAERGKIIMASGGLLTAYGTITLNLGELYVNADGIFSVPSGGIMYTINVCALQVDLGGLFSIGGNIYVGNSTTGTTKVLNGTVSLTGGAGTWVQQEGNGVNNVTMNSGSTLIMGPNATITGGGVNAASTTFTLAAGSSMQIGSAVGIASSGAVGNIQVQSTRSYSKSANYAYIGVVDQVTGNGLPDSVNNLTVNNPGNIITPTNGITVKGILTLSSGILVSTVAKMIQVSNTNTIAVTGTYNDSTYVDGPFKRKTLSTGEYLFPVGDGGRLKKAGVLPSSSSSANFTIEGFNSPPSNPTNLEPGIDHISHIEQWEITGSAPSQIKLYWSIYSTVDENLLSELLVVHYNTTNSLWESKGNAGTDAVANYILSDASASYSRHTFGATGNGGLPVELLYFNGENDGARNVLNWATASEINNDYFELQKSINGKDFSDLAKVKGAGNSSLTQYYSSVDDHPVNGYNYYRLYQVDYNGSIHYLPVVVVKVSGLKEEVQVFPNPSNGRNLFLFYSGEKERTCHLTIYDPAGKVVGDQKDLFLNPGFNSLMNVVGSFSRGTYFLSVMFSDGDEIYRQKLVITD